jgi:hypothetical protein
MYCNYVETFNRSWVIFFIQSVGRFHARIWAALWGRNKEFLVIIEKLKSILLFIIKDSDFSQ